MKGETQGLRSLESLGSPFAEISQIDSGEAQLVRHMQALFEKHYDAKLAGTSRIAVSAGQTIAPYFNRRGIEFSSITKGAITINGKLMQQGDVVRIDPGEIVEIAVREDSEIVKHIFPYRQALTNQPLPAMKGQISSDNPVVSIVIIAKDIEHHICHAILSAIEQSFVDIEILVIDDGSTDQTVAKCRSMAYFDKRVKVYVEPLGRNGVRKFGVQKAKGQYCLIIDGDDWLNQDAIEKMVSIARKEKSDCVVFGFDHVSDRTAEVWNPVYPTDIHQKQCPMYYDKDDQNALWVSYLNHTIWMYFFSTTIKAGIIDALIEIDLYEDLPFYFVIVQQAARPVLWNEVLYRYRRDRVGQSTANWHQVGAARKLSSLRIAVDQCLEIIKDDIFLKTVLLYKVRRIVDYELNVCAETSDAVGIAAWEKMWRTICRKFPLELADHLVDKNVQILFEEARKMPG